MENQQEEQLSAEELIARKEEMFKFYTESIPYLTAQYEYEKLLADIDLERLKRTQYAMQYATLMHSEQEAQRNSTSKDTVNKVEPKERKLKKS